MELGHPDVVLDALQQFIATIHTIIKPGSKNAVTNFNLGVILLLSIVRVYLSGDIVKIAQQLLVLIFARNSREQVVDWAVILFWCFICFTLNIQTLSPAFTFGIFIKGF